MTFEARHISVDIGGRSIVRDVDLWVAAGEVVGLIGPNGAGKSTLLKAMLGLRPRAAGDVMLDGKDFDTVTPLERARRVAFLPQERRVEWRLRGQDIVMLGRYPHQNGLGGPNAEDRAAVDRALQAVNGLAIADRPVAALSGGERSRILLARALAVEAPFLLVDEPTSALDPYYQLQVMEILRACARNGVGVIVVLHDLALAARFAHRLVLMHAGAVVAGGAPADVLTADVLQRVYHVNAERGVRDGEHWVLPWSRTARGREGAV